MDVERIVEDVEDHSLRGELSPCQHFLEDSVLERTKHRVLNYATYSLNLKIGAEKFDHFFSILKCAAKVNPAFQFIQKNTEDGAFKYFYAHENNTLLDRSEFTCTQEDLAKLMDFLSQVDVIESCTRKRMNTKWRFFKLTNITVFVAFVQDVPMGSRDTVLPEPLLKKSTIYCFTFEKDTGQPYTENSCLFLFRALALHLHASPKFVDETSKNFFCFIDKKDECNPNQFPGAQTNDLLQVEDMLLLDIFLYEIDVVEGDFIG